MLQLKELTDSVCMTGMIYLRLDPGVKTKIAFVLDGTTLNGRTKMFPCKKVPNIFLKRTKCGQSNNFRAAYR